MGFRDIEANLSCVVGVGSEAWDRLFGQPRPAQLHPFREINPGRVMRSPRPAIFCSTFAPNAWIRVFQLATQIMARIGDAISPVDETHGFRYFDDRDLIGFVDGTENPIGQAAIDSHYIGDETRVRREHLRHRAKISARPSRWNALPTEAQERIIGRTKLSDIELDDAVKPTLAHNALTTIVEDGKEIKIVRDNMPFGRVADGEFGTYFIGYARSPRTIEQMLENMFVGRPPGNYDRLLDFSVAKTGNLFFVPSATFLDSVGEAPAAAGPEAVAAAPAPARDGSLGIGSYGKEIPLHE